MMSGAIQAKLDKAGWLPINQCRRCGEEDDPESARRWPQDEDGDIYCWVCHNAALRVVCTRLESLASALPEESLSRAGQQDILRRIREAQEDLETILS